jgi:hypothetical protein
MKILNSSLIIVPAAAVGLAVGLALRGQSGSVSDPAELPAATVAAPADSRANPLRAATSHTMVRAKDDSPLATKLERDLSMSSGVTRWLYWLEALEKAALSDFPRLARLAEGNSTATRLLGARWVELDPRHLFDTIAGAKYGRAFPANELSSILFDEWPRRDPEAAIAALSGANNFGERRNWREYVAGVFVEKGDVERGLRLLSQWQIGNFAPDTTAVARWAAADPRHAAGFALANPAGYASRQAMETIGREWARIDPGRALEFATAQPGALGATLAASVLKNWAGRNLNEAADWLAGASASTRHRLSPAFAEAWSKQDPGAALAWSEANLAGSSLVQAVGGILKSAVERGVVGAAGLVSHMEPSSARSEAAVAVAQKWFPESSSGKPVPPEAIEWVTSLDAAALNTVLDKIGWRDSDPRGMAAFLLSNVSKPIANHIYSDLARNMARENPTEALAWAGRLPEERGVAAGVEAFSEWRRAQPETAMQWLNALPASDPRRQRFFQHLTHATGTGK